MKLIFVDDAVIFREAIFEAASSTGNSIRCFALPADVSHYDLRDTDVVVTDNRFGPSGYLGINFIATIRAAGFSGRVVLYTNHSRQCDIHDLAALGGEMMEKHISPGALIKSLCEFSSIVPSSPH